LTDEREEDPYGLEGGLDPEILEIWTDYRAWARTARGKRILAHIAEHCGASETKTFEELETSMGRPTPIDTTAFFLREGMRRLYRFILAQTTAIDDLENAKRMRGEE